MKLIPLKSRLIKPKDELLNALENALKKAKERLENGDILVVVSKVVSVSEGRIVATNSAREENRVARDEADVWLGGQPYPLAVKNGILIPWSGVDSSNSEAGKLILWPRDGWFSAKNLRKKIRKKWKLRNFGVLISDSTCRPLRWGVSGIALAWAGFAGVVDERGKKDLFGRKLKITQKAIADDFAAAAGVLTGEAAERIPFVLIRGAKVKFGATRRPRQFQPADDLFAPIYDSKFRRLKLKK